MSQQPTVPEASGAAAPSWLWAASDPPAAKPEPPKVERWVSFELDGQAYGLNVLDVQEALRHPDITPTRGAPPYVLGVTNIRGSIVTVIDLRIRLGLPPAAVTAATRVIILDLKPHPLGIVVDRIGEVLHVPQQVIEPAPQVGAAGGLRRPVSGLFVRNGVVVLRLDVGSLVNLA